MRVAHQTGVSDRRISSILNGEQKTVSLGTADKILTKLGLSHLWYLDPEDGGFSDVIWPEPEDEKQAWA
jgi:transcriptional regulator with XRE-family HTH domain